MPQYNFAGTIAIKANDSGRAIPRGTYTIVVSFGDDQSDPNS